jgi:cytochrome P450
MATEDTILPRGGGADGKAPVLVPKGCMVIYTVFALHRRKDLWGDDADDFRPERWEMGRKFAWVSLARISPCARGYTWFD